MAAALYLKYEYSSFPAARPGLFVPDRRLYFPYMGVAHQEHTEPALPYASAYGIRKFSVKERFMERQLPSVVAA